jgi:modulator of FtsH protease
MLPLPEWQSFFSVQASAAATLTGLVFVAVSINLRHIMSNRGLPGRAAESLVQLLQVFFVSSVLLVPRHSPRVLATSIFGIALIAWVIQTVAQVRYAKARGDEPWSWLLTRVFMTQLGTLPFCVAATFLLLGSSAGLYWLVPGFIFSFLAGVLSAWVLLVEILR